MHNDLAPSQNVSVSSQRLEHINCVVAPSLEEGGLYLGDIISTIKPSLLQQHRIEAILTCMHEHQIKAQCSRHLVVPLHDNVDFRISPYFSEAITFIEAARKDKMNVLVHCHAGLSRSPAIVCAYLMKKNNWTYADAIQFIKSSRQRIRINEGFAAQLIQYQQQRIAQTPPRKITHDRKDAQTSFSNIKVQGPLMFSDKKEPSTSIKLRRELVLKRMDRFSFNAKEEHKREYLRNTTTSVLENNSTIVNQSVSFFAESDRLTPSRKSSQPGMMMSSPIELYSRQPPLQWHPEELTKMQTSYGNLSRVRDKTTLQYERQPSIQPNLEIVSRQIRFGQVVKPLVTTMPSRSPIYQHQNPRSNMG